MQLTRRQMVIGSTMLVLSACAKREPKPTEGHIAVPGGIVAWRRFGDGPKTPLILIHGGPGFPSDYLEPFAALADERPVYVWDQLGCGRSDRPSDTALWTVERFVQEFDAVRTALAPGRVHILGHSWGSMLAMEWRNETSRERRKRDFRRGVLERAALYRRRTSSDHDLDAGVPSRNRRG